jgi:DNA-binding transcriptional MerR regulator
MFENDFSIQDLCDQTGLPRRTIHFYIQQEILPPPQGSGLGARYQAEHLVRLKLIPILRQQGLRLDAIRQKFNATSFADLQTLLDQSQLSAHGLPPIQVLPPTLPQPYLAYALPHGVVVLAPKDLAPAFQAKFQRLLQTLQVELS